MNTFKLLFVAAITNRILRQKILKRRHPPQRKLHPLKGRNVRKKGQIRMPSTESLDLEAKVRRAAKLRDYFLYSHSTIILAKLVAQGLQSS